MEQVGLASPDADPVIVALLGRPAAPLPADRSNPSRPCILRSISKGRSRISAGGPSIRCDRKGGDKQDEHNAETPLSSLRCNIFVFKRRILVRVRGTRTSTPLGART